MQTLLKSLCATSMLALVAGCSTPVVDTLENTEPTGSAFNRQLSAEYQLLAEFEADDMQDFLDAGHFAEKGIKAARNQPTTPDEVWSRDLPKQHVAELTQARARLTEAFEHDVRDRYPLEAAIAQAKFDCWLEQQEENYQPEHIAACRGAFQSALRSIHSQEQARLAGENQMADTSRSTDRAAPEATPASGLETLIFFEFDEATIPASEKDKLDSVAASVGKTRGDYTLIATGHADRAGSYEYNKALSVRRAEAVREALIGRGVKPSVIIVDGKGETAPLEPTADGVREADNRRVRLSVR